MYSHSNSKIKPSMLVLDFKRTKIIKKIIGLFKNVLSLSMLYSNTK